jgi:hypothetical protein
LSAAGVSILPEDYSQAHPGFDARFEHIKRGAGQWELILIYPRLRIVERIDDMGRRIELQPMQYQ